MKTILIFIFLILSSEIMGQLRQDRLVKFGGLPNYGIGSYPGNLSSPHIIGFEFEKISRRMEFLTHCYRFDYIPYLNQQFTLLGYNVKFYPRYLTGRRQPLRGIFLGAGPAIFSQEAGRMPNRYGPGVNVTAGYQVLIKNKLSIAYELDMHYLKNLNMQVPWNNPDNHWFTFFHYIKLGIKF
ncbi:MAG TPA: hypothetical protein VI583_01500 [Cyclobacteriaceae bacterium]|nr:hypothetical protein [Cyclobacteriaceae bacterium]